MSPQEDNARDVPNIRVWHPLDGETIEGLLAGSSSFEFKKGKPERLVVLETKDGLVAIPSWYEFIETMKQQKEDGKVKLRESRIEIKYLGSKKIARGAVAIIVVRLNGVVVASRVSKLATTEDDLPF